MKVLAESLEQLIYEDDYAELTKVSNEFVKEHRWETEWRLVFALGEQFFRTTYRQPATEMQEDGASPFYRVIGEDGLVDCTEVFEIEVTSLEYVPASDPRL